MLGRPPCSNCGSRFLVARVLTSGALFRPSERYYRCYRCFTVFTPDNESSGDGAQRNVPKSTRRPGDARPRAEIVDARLTLEKRGTKFAVEEFAVTVRNRSDRPIRVTQLRLTFDGTEEKTAPKDEEVIPPGETETVDVLWSWIHPDQNAVTIEVRSDGETLAITDTAVPVPC